MTKNLEVYLNDHLAGATGAVELLEHMSADPKSPAAGFASGLRDDVAADRATLLDLMTRLHITVSSVRTVTGWIGEKVAMLKVVVDDPSDGSLRLFELLEALALGILGKRALWTALQAVSASDPEIAALDFARLLQRSDDQYARVETYRVSAAVDALGASQRLTS